MFIAESVTFIVKFVITRAVISDGHKQILSLNNYETSWELREPTLMKLIFHYKTHNIKFYNFPMNFVHLYNSYINRLNYLMKLKKYTWIKYELCTYLHASYLNNSGIMWENHVLEMVTYCLQLLLYVSLIFNVLPVRFMLIIIEFFTAWQNCWLPLSDSC